jgi:hypothetical protein
MCRSIKKLRLPGGPASREEVEASALQFVRKVSGFRAPSRINTKAFETAVQEISDITEQMLAELHANAVDGKAGQITRSA